MPESPSRKPGEYWIDLVDPSPGDIERVSRECGLDVPDRAALEEVEASSRLRCDGKALYLSMPLAVHQTSQVLEPMPFGLILTPEVLITVRYGEVRALGQVRDRLASSPPGSSNEAFATLAETLIDIGADLLEASGGQLARLSAHIFRSPEILRPHDKRPGRDLRRHLRSVGVLGDDLSHLRETLLGLQRIVGFVAERAIGGLPPELATRLRTAGTDIASLIDFETHLTNKTQFLLDAILGFINTEQNDIFKLLTIVSVAGIPPTLIASIYGMNFHVMPELGWRFGYPFALALILLSALLPMLWFRRRGWW
jgi:magnesium transporter